MVCLYYFWKRMMNVLTFATFLLLLLLTLVVDAFSNSRKEIYGVKNSGWTSKEWNWGSAIGTGHDCAAICRRQYSTRQARENLVQNLLQPNLDDPSKRKPANFEEVKLVLGLVFQNGRWDGSDGGPGGYGEILSYMAEAKRYEVGGGGSSDDDDDDDECTLRFVQDMQDKFDLLADNTSLELREMRSILDDTTDMDYVRRRCCGLVLEAMGFVEKNF